MEEQVKKSKEQWKKSLSSEEYHVLREKGTEPPGTGKLLHNKKEGTYVCAGCGKELFSSETKYDSGSGWPAFWAPISEEGLHEKPDLSLGMRRTEVLCPKCRSHLGHVFNDGPEPSGRRFCINSAALHFKEKKK